MSLAHVVAHSDTLMKSLNDSQYRKGINRALLLHLTPELLRPSQDRTITTEHNIKRRIQTDPQAVRHSD